MTTNFEPECLEIYIKNGVELPEDQWRTELSVDYFEDNGCHLDEKKSGYIGYDEPYISKSGNTYGCEIYYSGKTISELIDCVIEDGHPNAIIDILESVKKIPNNILHDLLVGTELHWPGLARKIKYKNGRYIV